jgi:hypothetical protein
MIKFSGDRLCIIHRAPSCDQIEEGGRTTYIECGVQKLGYPLHIEHVWLIIR